MQIFHWPPLAILLSGLLAPPAMAWDYEGHRMVNQIALAALPADFPAFVRVPAAAERIAFLSGEPDRWRNNSDHPIKHAASLDHYFDYEQLAAAGFDEMKVPDMRFMFATQFAAGRASHLSEFPPIDEAKNDDHTHEWPGFAPWAITENYGKLKSGFSYLKVYQELGNPEEIANAEANIIYIMGTMGHYVGDIAQPLHLSNHHNGWVGENPDGFTRWPGIHAWIDGGFKAGIKPEGLIPRATPAEPWPLMPSTGGRDPMFIRVMELVKSQHEFVRPLYLLEKAGAFKEETAATSGEGRAFIEARLLTGGQTLASIWLTAWKEAGPDPYLRTQLIKRREPTSSPPSNPAD